MKIRKLVIITVLFLNLSLCNAVSVSSDSVSVFLVNTSYHTGFIIKLDEILKNENSPFKLFDGNNIIDIGWGDADFYMSEEFDLILAAKALFIPTNSVIRAEIPALKFEDIIKLSDYAIEIKLSRISFNKFISYIHNSFFKKKDGKYVIAKSDDKMNVVYFKSLLKYHLFFTCNTWAAKALETAGCEISPTFVITDEQLFKKAKIIGKILKR